MIEELGWLPELEYVRMVGCRIGGTGYGDDDDDDECGRKFGIL